MENFNIERYNPLKAEIASLVENVKSTVASASGATGYELMKENKKVLQSKRTDTVKYLKGEREGFIAGQKFVIGLEKEVLAIIEPVESELDRKIGEIDEARKREERRALMPERIEKLISIEYLNADFKEEAEENMSFLLDMDEKQFATFFMDEREKYLNEKQRKIDEQNEQIANEAREKEAQAQREAEAEQNKKVAEAKAKLDYRKKRLLDIGMLTSFTTNEFAFEELSVNFTQVIEMEDEKFDAMCEDINHKIGLIKETKMKADIKAKADKDAADQAAAGAEKAAELERSRKYQAFLKENGVTKENAATDFYIQTTGQTTVLYKKVAEFKR